MIFKRRKNKELTRIRSELDRRTADYRGDDIWDLSEFLMLLNLSDHDKTGKSKAIIYAYKLGCVDERKSMLHKITEYCEKRRLKDK